MFSHYAAVRVWYVLYMPPAGIFQNQRACLGECCCDLRT